MSTAKIAARGAAWTIATSLLSRGLGLIGTLVLVRFVAPGDYGEASAAMVVVLTINQLTTLGVGVYAIATRDATREDLFHATFIHVSLGLLAFLVLVLLGKPLSPLFDTPNMYRYVPGLAAAALMDRVTTMPERILIRKLRFRRLSVVRSMGELTYAAVSVAAAWLGMGGMAIVVGNLARAGTRVLGMVGSVALADWFQVGRLRKAILRKVGGYGLTTSLSQVAYSATRRWDNLLVSHFFGPAVMGTYNLAYNLADLPAIHIGEQITDVMQASFTHMDSAERRRTLLRSLGVVGLVTFPIAVGLGAVAPTLADLFLDRKWAGAGAMLLVLSMLSLVRPVYGSISSYILVELGPRPLVMVEWVTLATLMGGLATLGRISPLWSCGTVGLVFGLRSLLAMLVARAKSRIPIWTFVRELLPPLVACVPMALVVFGLRFWLARLGVGAPILRLVAQVLAGGLVFVGAAFALAPRPARDVMALVRDRSRGRRPPDVVPVAQPAAQGAGGQPGE